MKLLNLILSSCLFIIFSSGCNATQSAPGSELISPNVQPTANLPVNVKSNSVTNVSQTNAARDENSFECVRAAPEPIVKKTVFPKTSFTLQKNKEFPYQPVGFETIEFENGDKLTIENTGCENYTLIFRFETSRFSGAPDDADFWHRTAVRLIEQTKKGLVDQTNLVTGGTKALNSYIKKNKTLEFAEEIDFGGAEIRDVVMLRAVKKREDNRYEIELSFGTGPL